MSKGIDLARVLCRRCGHPVERLVETPRVLFEQMRFEVHCHGEMTLLRVDELELRLRILPWEVFQSEIDELVEKKLRARPSVMMEPALLPMTATGKKNGVQLSFWCGCRTDWNWTTGDLIEPRLCAQHASIYGESPVVDWFRGMFRGELQRQPRIVNVLKPHAVGPIAEPIKEDSDQGFWPLLRYYAEALGTDVETFVRVCEAEGEERRGSTFEGIDNPVFLDLCMRIYAHDPKLARAVGRELADFERVMHGAETAYYELTDGKFRKANTAPEHIITAVREVQERDQKEAVEDALAAHVAAAAPVLDVETFVETLKHEIAVLRPRRGDLLVLYLPEDDATPNASLRIKETLGTAGLDGLAVVVLRGNARLECLTAAELARLGLQHIRR